MPSDIESALADLASMTETRIWNPRDPVPVFCSVGAPCDPDEIRTAWGDRVLPPEVVELWLSSRETVLFEDPKYRQWGLVLPSPMAAAELTASLVADDDELRSDDLVIGQFLGDGECLIISPSEGDAALVRLEIDRRPEWPRWSTLGEFLLSHVARAGGKSW